jgi:RHS repeat-associated protein
MALPLASPHRVRKNRLRWRWAASGRRHYNYFRDYDSSTGRYAESDPIGLRGGISTFGYVLGNPLGFADPSGLEVGSAITPASQMSAMGAADAEALNQEAAAMSAAMQRVRCLVANDYANRSPTDAFNKAQRDKMTPSQFPGYTDFDLTSAEHYIMAYNFANSGINGGGWAGGWDVALPFATPGYVAAKSVTQAIGHGPFHNAGKPSVEEVAAGWAGWADAVRGKGAGGGSGCGCH